LNRDPVSDFDRMVEELRREIVQREQQLYSATVLREVSNPQNVGVIPDADMHGVVQGWCGDTMEIFMRLNGGTIEEATFVTDGCGTTVACGSMLTQMVTGMTLAEAEWLLAEDLIEALNGLPEESMHCAGLAVSTLQNALFNWRMLEMREQEEER
jgi:nitrogen fixation NifU-like protein